MINLHTSSYLGVLKGDNVLVKNVQNLSISFAEKTHLAEGL